MTHSHFFYYLHHHLIGFYFEKFDPMVNQFEYLIPKYPKLVYKTFSHFQSHQFIRICFHTYFFIRVINYFHFSMNLILMLNLSHLMTIKIYLIWLRRYYYP